MPNQNSLPPSSPGRRVYVLEGGFKPLIINSPNKHSPVVNPTFETKDYLYKEDVHLVEPAPMDESDPIENYELIRKELVQYKAELGHRPEIVVVSKGELPEAEETAKKLAEKII